MRRVLLLAERLRERRWRRRNLPGCSFCGKGGHQVEKIISGPDSVAICNECVELCVEIIDEEAKGEALKA